MDEINDLNTKGQQNLKDIKRHKEAKLAELDQRSIHVEALMEKFEKDHPGASSQAAA